ncbi:MAG: glycosyltransferase [Candidatus Omnitrophota bacterium]|nr:glycosyltransferase [Candidatus Omnitrophota bacterium]
MQKVAYLLHKFPVLSESFISDEILAVAKNGIEICIFAFEENKEQIRHKEAEELLKRAVFAADPKDNFKAFMQVIAANLFFFLRNPALYLTYFFKYFFKLGKKEFLQIFYLGYLIKKERVTHLHVHFAYLGATAAMIISAFLKIPFSFTVHARDIFVPDCFLKDKLLAAQFVIAISNYNKDYLLNKYPNIPAGKIKISHCGVNTQLFMPKAKASNAGIHILSGARLVEKKGFTYLLKACKLLAAQGIQFKCDIFGEGPLNEQLHKEVKELGLEAIVDFKGVLDKEGVLNLISASDIFVLPCIIANDGDRDGIPVVLMEAMASGLATVSIDISGIPELINSGRDGVLVKQKDEAALAEVIRGLIENAGLRRDLAINARIKIEEFFNINKNVKLLTEIFTAKPSGPISFFHSGKREHVPCNLCGSDKPEVLFSGVSFDGFKYNHIRCKECGLIYADPMPSLTNQELCGMSLELWHKDFLESSSVFNWNHFNRYREYNRLRVKALMHYVKGTKLLEVGCGNGYFLKAAKDNGWQVYGIEVCERLAAHINKYLEVNIFAGTLEQAKFSDNFFDVVYLNHLLEHLSDPLGFLTEARRILKEDGILFVCLPNARDIFEILRKAAAQLCLTKGWKGYLNPPMHLYAFSPASLVKLLEKAGFRTLEMFTIIEGNRMYFPDYSNFTLKKMCKRLVAFPMQMVGMGAHVVVYAAKR